MSNCHDWIFDTQYYFILKILTKNKIIYIVLKLPKYYDNSNPIFWGTKKDNSLIIIIFSYLFSFALSNDSFSRYHSIDQSVWEVFDTCPLLLFENSPHYV